MGLTPRFHQDRSLPSPNGRNGKKGEETVSAREHDRPDRNNILFFYYFLYYLYDKMSRDLSRFSRSAKHRQPGEQIKAFLKFSKIVLLHFSLSFSLNGTNGW